MDYPHILGRLKVILHEKFPNQRSHAKRLAEILGIRPHSVYRKLSGVIQLSLDDLAKISAALSIPLGSLLDDNWCVYSHPMELVLIDNISQEQSYKYAVETVHDIFELAGKSGNAKYTAVCRNIPIISLYYYDWLMKFANLKWIFFNRGVAGLVPLSEMAGMNEYMRVKDIYIDLFRSMRRLVFIIDGDLVRNFTQDLLFSIKLRFSRWMR